MHWIFKWSLVVCAIALSTSCGRAPFAFDLTNRTGGMVADFKVSFSGDRGTWSIGAVSKDGGKTVANIPGPVPDAADVTWTDASGATHLQHVSIDPSKADKQGSSLLHVYFTVLDDGSVIVSY